MSTTNLIREFIAGNFLSGISPDELDDDYDLLATGVIDSFGLLKLLGWIEERFKIDIDMREIAPADFRSVSAIQGFVERD